MNFCGQLSVENESQVIDYCLNLFGSLSAFNNSTLFQESFFRIEKSFYIFVCLDLKLIYVCENETYRFIASQISHQMLLNHHLQLSCMWGPRKSASMVFKPIKGFLKLTDLPSPNRISLSDQRQIMNPINEASSMHVLTNPIPAPNLNIQHHKIECFMNPRTKNMQSLLTSPKRSKKPSFQFMLDMNGSWT